MYVAGTTPYPWPYDGRLDEAGTALLLVERAGPGAVPGGAARAAVAALVSAAGAAGAPIIRVTTTLPDVALRRGAGGSAGSTADSSVGLSAEGQASVPAPGDPTNGRRIDQYDLVARGVDAFHESDLELVLTGLRVRRLVLAGSPLELDVHSTMRSANDRGYEVLLVVDASTAVEPTLVGASRSMVEMSGGIFGAVGATTDVVAAWTSSTALASSTSSTPVPSSLTAPKEH